MNVPKDFEEFFKLLNQEKVKYLIVGAYGVAYHGQPRFTGDIDIFVASNKTNAGRLMKVLRKFGFGHVGVTKEYFLQPDRIVQLGYPPLRIDLLTSINGIAFDKAWAHRVKGTFGKQNVWYISRRNVPDKGRSTFIWDIPFLGKT